LPGKPLSAAAGHGEEQDFIAEAGGSMTLLIIGIILWAAAHFVPALAPGFRQGLVDRFGPGPYRGIFSLSIVASLVLIVAGWRSAPDTSIYALPDWSRQAGFLLMYLSFVLFAAAYCNTAIRRFIRHPMLVGVLAWSVSHLAGNSSGRAIILFGGLGIWALIEMPVISAREEAYTLPDAPGFSGELKLLFISAILFLITLYLHPYIAGVSLISV